MSAIPITELPNELTTNIDISDSSGIVQLLQQCDAQLFSGWENHPGLCDEGTLKSAEKLSKVVFEVLSDPCSSAIVFSGCGTSGRLGFALARRFNSLAKLQGINCPGLYEYLIAGGDVALFTSQEIPEDDWKQGQTDLENLTRGKKLVVFVGITCGFSAPYVAGQLEYCMDNVDIFIPVLIGFNPVDLARRRPIEGWSKTFFDVASRLQSHKTGIILNPIIGPEAITGSSRMKGGSATKILLEAALLQAHYKLLSPDAMINPTSIFTCYKAVYGNTYLFAREISTVINIAGNSLERKGHVYYVAWGSIGFMALLDASECVPTFSASFDDIRAFVNGGFNMLQNKEGELDVELNGSRLQISVKDFEANFLPNVTNADTVVMIFLTAKHLKKVEEMVHQLLEKDTKVICITALSLFSSVKYVSNNFDIFFRLKDEEWKTISQSCFPHSCPVQNAFIKCLSEMAIKWILNAVSTGAHVMKGKVLRSYMIDVKVSNNKLFHRAVSIVSKFSHVSEQSALVALLKSIYRTDEVTEQLMAKATSQHVKVGMLQEKVVPLAVLLATEKFIVDSGLSLLKEKTVAKVLQDINMLE